MSDFETPIVASTHRPLPTKERQNAHTDVVWGIRLLTSVLGQSARRVEQRTGLTNAQLFILQLLAREPGLSINAIAARALTGQSTASLIVSRLERAGHVRRVRDADDARRVTVRLTESGLMQVSVSPEPPTRRLFDAVARLDDDDISSLGIGLRKLMAAMGVDEPSSMPLYEHAEDDTQPVHMADIKLDEAPSGETREALHLYRLLVDSVADYAIYAIDPTGRILNWNIGAERLKGYSADEIVGQSFSRFFAPGDVAAGLPQRALQAAESDGRFATEGWRIRKDGSRFWAHVVMTALRGDDGQLIGFAKITRDLTERRAAEARAVADAAQIASAQSANRAKARFLATMSHELRTPLHAIGGFGEILLAQAMGSLTDQQRHYVKRVFAAQRNLLAIINDILEYTRTDERGAGPVDASCTLARVVRIALAKLSVRIADKHLTVDTAALGDEHVRATADRCEPIVRHLLTNAVHFTPDGGRITIRSEARGDDVALTVSDTGPGIPTDMLDMIFDPFTQVGRTLNSAHEGTGLGLAISRNVAQALSGSLEADNSPEGGSIFTLVLPVAGS